MLRTAFILLLAAFSNNIHSHTLNIVETRHKAESYIYMNGLYEDCTLHFNNNLRISYTEESTFTVKNEYGEQRLEKNEGSSEKVWYDEKCNIVRSETPYFDKTKVTEYKFVKKNKDEIQTHEFEDGYLWRTYTTRLKNGRVESQSKEYFNPKLKLEVYDPQKAQEKTVKALKYHSDGRLKAVLYYDKSGEIAKTWNFFYKPSLIQVFEEDIDSGDQWRLDIQIEREKVLSTKYYPYDPKALRKPDIEVEYKYSDSGKLKSKISLNRYYKSILRYEIDFESLENVVSQKYVLPTVSDSFDGPKAFTNTFEFYDNGMHKKRTIKTYKKLNSEWVADETSDVIVKERIVKYH